MSLTPTINNITPSLQKCRSLRSLNVNHHFIKFVSNPKVSPKLELPPTKSKDEFKERQDIERNYRPTLTRVRSVDRLSELQIDGYENLLELHLKENENLKEQNRFLMKEIKKKEKNETVLNSYIEQLRREIKELQTNSVSPLTFKSKGELTARTSSSKYQSDRNITMETEANDMPNFKTSKDLKTLNLRFNSLMEQCCFEKCKKTRGLLREELAETANEMKNLRNRR